MAGHGLSLSLLLSTAQLRLSEPLIAAGKRSTRTVCLSLNARTHAHTPTLSLNAASQHICFSLLLSSTLYWPASSAISAANRCWAS